MNAKTVISSWVGVVAMFVCLSQTTRVSAQGSGTVLGSVRIPEKVTANGAPLAAGTYSLRLTNDSVTAVTGEAPDSEKWVEFVQGGQVKGKELASVVPASDIKQVAEAAPPKAGMSKVQTLKSADYLRIWINHGGTHYLIHLIAAK